MRAIYTAHTEGVVAVAANTSVVVFGVKGDTGHALDLLGLTFSLDQATPTATDKACLFEFLSVTFATNAPGTNSTAVAVAQLAGPRIAETFSAAKNWTAAPTVITVVDAFDVDPYKFTFKGDEPYGETPDFAAAEGFALRVSNPSGNASSVNVRARARFARV
jgi:hypothetical protein